MSESTLFRHYLISKSRQGNPVELIRSENEVVCLAYDTKLRRLINLHALIEPVEDAGDFQQRTKSLHLAQHPGLAWFLEAGEDEGAWYYVTAHADGERLPHYLSRIEQIPAYIAASLAASVAESLLALRNRPDLIPNANLDFFTVEAGPVESRTLLTHFQMKPEPDPWPGKPPARGHVMKRARALLETVAQKAGARWIRMEAQVSSATFRSQLEALLNAPRELVLDALKEILPWLLEASSGAEPSQELPPPFRPLTFLGAHLSGGELAGKAFRDQFVPDTTHTENSQGYEFPGKSDLGDDRLTLQVLPSRPICGEEPRQEVRRVLLRHSPGEHPHLLRVLSFEDAVSSVLFLEERPAGQTLAAWKDTHQPVPFEDALPILDALTQALKESELLGMKPFGLDPEDVYITPLAASNSQSPHWKIQWRAHPSLKKLIRRPVADSVEYPSLDYTWLACWLFDYQPDTPAEGAAGHPEVRECLSLVWQRALQGEPLPPHEVAYRLRQAFKGVPSTASSKLTAVGVSSRPVTPAASPLSALAQTPAEPSARTATPPADQNPQRAAHGSQDLEPVRNYAQQRVGQQVEAANPFRGGSRGGSGAPHGMTSNPIFAPPPPEEEEEDPVAFAALTRPAYAELPEPTPQPESEHGLAEVLFSNKKRQPARQNPQRQLPPVDEEEAGWMDQYPEDEEDYDHGPAYRDSYRGGMPFLFKLLLVIASAALLATFLRNARHGTKSSTPSSQNASPATTPGSASSDVPVPAAVPVEGAGLNPGVRAILEHPPETPEIPLPEAPSAQAGPAAALPGAPEVEPLEEELSSLPAVATPTPPPAVAVPEPSLPEPAPRAVPQTRAPAARPLPDITPEADPVPALPEEEPIPRAIPVTEPPASAPRQLEPDEAPVPRAIPVQE